MQAGRWSSGQLGLKYRPDRHTLITIGFRVDKFVIARPLGRNALKHLPTLIYSLTAITEHPVYIKKLTIHEIEQLSQFQLVTIKHALDVHPWSVEAPEDDDTFPENILNIRQSLDLTIPNSSLANFRGKVSRFKRFGIQPEIISDTNLCHDLHVFIKSYRVGAEDSFVGYAYATMLQTLKVNSSQERIKWFVARINKEIVGFFLAETTGGDTAALYASLSHKSIHGGVTGLSEYLYRVMMEKLNDEGFLYLNLGGSESETLHAYKRKFNPFGTRHYRLLVALPLQNY